MVLDIEADAEMTTATKLDQTDEDMNQIGSIYECEFHDLGGKKSTKMTGKQVNLNMYFPSLTLFYTGSWRHTITRGGAQSAPEYKILSKTANLHGNDKKWFSIQNFGLYLSIHTKNSLF